MIDKAIEGVGCVKMIMPTRSKAVADSSMGNVRGKPIISNKENNIERKISKEKRRVKSKAMSHCLQQPQLHR